MRLRYRILIGVVLTVALLLILTACSDKTREPFHDAPRSDYTNSEEADIIEMPDGFSNAATKCDHGNRVYVLYHGSSAYGSVAVSPHDPSCTQVGTAATIYSDDE